MATTRATELGQLAKLVTVDSNGNSVITGTFDATLPASGVIAGVHGSASSVPIMSVTAQGLIDSVGSAPINTATSISFDSATGQLTLGFSDTSTISQTLTLDPFTTADLTEGSNLYYTDARFDSTFGDKSTTNLTEGDNLYYTQGRFDSALGDKTTDDLTEGSNLYYTQARFNSAFTAKSTSDLSEGSNLYYTTARADSDAKAVISVTDAGGDGSLTYSAGAITYTGPSASEVRAHFSGGTGVDISSGVVSIGQNVDSSSNVIFQTVETTGNVTIGGNLQVNGATTTVSSQNLSIEDNMLYLNQLESDGSPTIAVDVGFAANVNDTGSYAHTGFFRDATDATWKLFDGYTPEPDSDLDIDISHASFSYADLQVADLTAANVTADGLTVDGDSITANAQDALTIEFSGAEGVISADRTGGNFGELSFKTTAGAAPLSRLKIAYNGGISFYEDTGTTPKFFWDASAENLYLANTNPVLVGVSTGVVSATSFTVGGQTSGTDSMYIRRAAAADYQLQTTNTGSSSGEIHLQPYGGNVGIGTSSPSAKLDVNGEVFVSPNTAGKNTFQLTTNASDDARFKMLSDTTEKVDIQANGNSYFNGGNVGIGTTSPSAMLEFGPNTTDNKYDIKSPSDNARGIGLGSYTTFSTRYSNWDTLIGTNIRSKIGTSSSGEETASSYTASGGAGLRIGFQDLEFKTYSPAELSGLAIGSDVNSLGTTRFKVDTNGVGIGTNSPDFNTHSAIDYAGNNYLGDGEVYAIAITNENTTATNAVAMTFGHGTYNYTHYIASIRKSSGANPWGDLSIGGRPSDGAGFVDRIYLQGNTGNVGIGNINPNKPLTITSDSGANTLGLRARSADDYSFIQFFNHAGTALRGQIYSNAVGDIGFTTGTDSSAGNDLYIKNGTGVGIGTSSPSTKLHVNGNSALTGGKDPTMGAWGGDPAAVIGGFESTGNHDGLDENSNTSLIVVSKGNNGGNSPVMRKNQIWLTGGISGEAYNSGAKWDLGRHVNSGVDSRSRLDLYLADVGQAWDHAMTWRADGSGITHTIIGSTSPTYTDGGDNTPLVGSKTTSRLHVNGSIQLTSNDDAIVFGRGSASFLKDEELGFGWGGGWYMTDGTYLRVRNNKVLYNNGQIRSDVDMRAPIFYDQSDTAYYIDPASTADTALKIRGGALFGPNTTWGDYLMVGGDGRQNYTNNTTVASVATTDGNLHLDAASGHGLYLNFYDGDNLLFGGGSNNIVASVSSSGVGSFISITDYNNTAYYFDGSATSDSIRVAGDIVAYYSDERLKDKEGNISGAIDKVSKLNGFYYRANKKAQELGYDTQLQVGVSAQEVEAVLPEVVKDAPIGQGYKTVKYDRMVPLLIEAIKEQQEIINTQGQDIDELKQLVKQLMENK